MTHPASGPVRTVAALAVATLLAVASNAQPVASCQRALPLAESRYIEGMFADVEPLLLPCVYAAEGRGVQPAYRLLALSYIKQGFLEDARMTVALMVQEDSTYDANEASDLPAYVSLVAAVRDEMGVADVVALPVSPDELVLPDEPVLQSSSDEADLLVNVNTASVGQLDTVPGIGPALAGRIVAHRQQYGSFSSVGDLEDVRGIGARSLERMATFLAVEGQSTTVALPSTLRMEQVEIPSGKVNINTATAGELESLPGIGPALAARIIEFREEYGRFGDVSEITLVRGIGPRTLEGLMDRAVIE